MGFCWFDGGCWGDWAATIGPGTLPEWIAAIGTSAAFLVAAFAFRHDVGRRREAQARLVFAFVAGATKHLAGSKIYGVGDVRGVVTSFAETKSHKDAWGNPYLSSAEPQVLITVTIRNESPELIGPVLVLLEGPGVTMPEMALGAAIVLPGDSANAQILCSWAGAPAEPRWYNVIAFRDSSGVWWTRSDSDPIARATRAEASRFSARAKETSENMA